MKRDVNEKNGINSDKNRCRSLNYIWSIGVLIGIIVLLLTYKLWDKGEPLQTLISVGGSLISITLGILAIIYSMIESIKTNSKEEHISYILSQIQSKVVSVKDSVITMQKKMENFEKAKEAAIKDFNWKDYNNKINSSNDLRGSIQVENQISNNENFPICLHKFKRGDIGFAELKSGDDNIIRGFRPVIIYQSNKLNNYAPTFTVIPLTSKICDNDNMIPTHVKVECMNKISMAIVEQIRTITVKDLKDYYETLDESTLQEIDKAVRFQFGIQEEHFI